MNLQIGGSRPRSGKCKLLVKNCWASKGPDHEWSLEWFLFRKIEIIWGVWQGRILYICNHLVINFLLFVFEWISWEVYGAAWHIGNRNVSTHPFTGHSGPPLWRKEIILRTHFFTAWYGTLVPYGVLLIHTGNQERLILQSSTCLLKFQTRLWWILFLLWRGKGDGRKIISW